VASRKPEVVPKQVYRTTAEAIEDGWPEEIKGTALRLADYNLLAHLGRGMIRANPARDGQEVVRFSVSAFQRMCEVAGGSWHVMQDYTLGTGLSFPNRLAAQPMIEGVA